MRGPATPFPAGPRGRGRCFLPRSQRRAWGGGLQTGHDVTAGGGAGGPSIPAEEPRPRSPVPSLLPGSRRDFLFLCGAPGFARRWLPAGDKTRSLGEGRRRQSQGPGAGGTRARAPPEREPGSAARAPQPCRRRSTPPRPGAGIQAGARPGPQPPAARTHAGPQPPGARGRPAPTRGAAVGAARVPRPLQQLEQGLPPLLGHGRAAGGERPPRRTRAPRRPPAAAASAPSRAAQPARRFRIPAARPAPPPPLSSPPRPPSVCRRGARGARRALAGAARGRPPAARAEGRADGLLPRRARRPSPRSQDPPRDPQGRSAGRRPPYPRAEGPPARARCQQPRWGWGHPWLFAPTAPGHLLCPGAVGRAQRASRGCLLEGVRARP